MAQAALTAVGPHLAEGVVAGPKGSGSVPDHIAWLDAGHPLPDAASLRAGLHALDLAHQTTPGDLLLVLLSGGGSAMLEAPLDGLSLDDLRSVTASLLRSGTDIAGMNCVRRHLSAIKGGRLGVAAGACLTLAISDVHDPEDDPTIIASGPTVADPTTRAMAVAVLDRAGIDPPRAVRALLERGADGRDTVKPGDPRLARTTMCILANRRTAMSGAEEEAERRGYKVVVLQSPTRGEAVAAGRQFVEAARARTGAPGPWCVIASGETTVRVHGAGTGGRNQEFVLAAARALATEPGQALVASAGTDGVDGPTDAAGAWADSNTMERAGELRVDIEAALVAHDAYPALARLGNLIKWGPTLTNVGDLHILLTM